MNLTFGLCSSVLKCFFPVVKPPSRTGLRHEVLLAADRSMLACMAGAGFERDSCISALKLGVVPWEEGCVCPWLWKFLRLSLLGVFPRSAHDRGSQPLAPDGIPC